MTSTFRKLMSSKCIQFSLALLIALAMFLSNSNPWPTDSQPDSSSIPLFLFDPSSMHPLSHPLPPPPPDFFPDFAFDPGTDPVITGTTKESRGSKSVGLGLSPPVKAYYMGPNTPTGPPPNPKVGLNVSDKSLLRLMALL